MVKTTSIAHRFSIRVSPPQGCRVRSTIATARAFTFSRGLKLDSLNTSNIFNKITAILTHQASLRFHEWSIGSIHLIIEATGITEIVTITITSPQWSWGCSTVHTFTTFWNSLHMNQFEGITTLIRLFAFKFSEMAVLFRNGCISVMTETK